MGTSQHSDRLDAASDEEFASTLSVIRPTDLPNRSNSYDTSYSPETGVRSTTPAQYATRTPAQKKIDDILATAEKAAVEALKLMEASVEELLIMSPAPEGKAALQAIRRHLERISEQRRLRG